MSDLLTRIARERELEKIRGRRRLTSGQAAIVEQLPLTQLLQTELNKLRRLMPPDVAADPEQVEEYLGGPEFSEVFPAGSAARAKALKIFEYFLGVADSHDLTVIELLGEYGIDYRAPIGASAAKPARLAKPAKAAKPHKPKKVTGWNRAMLAVLNNEHGEPSKYGAHFGSKKDKIALRDLVKRGLARIMHEEKTGPEGPQLYAKITPAGLAAYNSGFYPPVSTGKTKLDLLLDQVKARKREVTIDTTGYTREQVDRILHAAKDRGLHAAAAPNSILIRDLR